MRTPRFSPRRSRLFATLLCVVLTAIPLAMPLPVAHGSMLSVDVVPIRASVTPGTQTGGSSVTITIEVGEVPSQGGSCQVSTDHPEILNSPTGSWPYSFSFPSGSSTTRSFTVTTNAVTSSTTVTVCSARNGVDISNPANWDASTQVSITP